MNTLVSIIVPCFKQAHFLNESLQSVLNQTYPNWECIIVNDGSPDNTEIVAKQWCTKDKRFKYLYKENGGLSSARNAGITVGTGEFILPLDADDLIHETFLEKLVPVLNNDKALAIVSCYSKFFEKNINNIVKELKPKGNDYRFLLYVNQLIATSLYRKECWEAVGGYDESMKAGFEDWEFWLAITKTGRKYKIIEEFLFYYRRAKKSMLVDTISNYAENNKEYIFKKHSDIYIKDFENCMTVLFYHIKTHRDSEIKLKNSLEYKIGKILCKPFRMFKIKGK
ncbi:glycosyltransferase family 2 protein [Mariniflexile gromovii]|uniref:Glycosyltransferase family 2 protein n=1 Tax=Mariniflexile gromovii TaxID=362523 RepID=A0ABS4BVD5_9FLAO|nr:glycosyltransferase family A protein [Mariniflexile gromovii]MBP0904522.1 glycosyltransferase family 2 protein [Mariniflexile gromovii]